MNLVKYQIVIEGEVFLHNSQCKSAYNRINIIPRDTKGEKYSVNGLFNIGENMLVYKFGRCFEEICLDNGHPGFTINGILIRKS